MKETTNFQESMNAAMAYEAPQVEIIEVAVEKGFAGSGDFEEGQDATGTGSGFVRG